MTAHAEPRFVSDELRALILAGTAEPAFAPAAESVPVTSLVLFDSPRLSGGDGEHVRRLAGVETRLPPVLVHRPTMRVIDGWHRIRAVVFRGEDFVDVLFFDGRESDVFALAVAANVGHGLPLTLADREAAAGRIVTAHPTWSDRMIATTTGLAAGTVAAIRRRQDTQEPGERVGRDGRVRPVDPAPGRRLASEIIADRPDAPLRAVAREAGVSLATAHDVRQRMQRGDVVVPSKRDATGEPDLDADPPAGTAGTTRRVRSAAPGVVRVLPAPEEIWRSLRNDPSLRFTETGRSLLRWLLPRVAGPRGWTEVAVNIPPHCKYAVAGLARHCADEWRHFAEQMEQQARSSA